MMKLYIQIENGEPVNHPAFEENLMSAFGGVPDNWKPFVRVERPVLGEYEMLESEVPVYQQVNGVWMDVWSVRPMTAEEINVKKESVKQTVLDIWALRPDASNFTAWVYDEATQNMAAPIPRPIEEGKIFRWSGVDNNWKEAPAKPEDGGEYKFSFEQWVWIKVND